MSVQWHETGSGLYVPAEAKRPRPIGIDLFCGAGGFSLGFMAAGFEVVAAADWDPICMQTYLINLGAWPVNLVFVEDADRDRAAKAIEAEFRRQGFMDRTGEWTGQWVDRHGIGMPVSGANSRARPKGIPGVGTFFLGDIGNLTGERILRECGLERGEVDVVFGGPPCQGFSSAGKQDVMDPRNSYVFEFVRLVLEIQPKTMVFENVPEILNMTTPDGLPVVDVMCRALSDGGFGAVDSLKRSLLATSGAGAAMRGSTDRKTATANGKTKRAQASAATQSSFFDMGGAS